MADNCTRTMRGCSGFGGLATAQFLGAFNDNLFKTIVSLAVVDAGSAGSDSAAYLALVGAIFVAPYLLFSGYAGRLLDILNKRRVIVAVKAAEVLAMTAAALSLLQGGVVPLLGALLLAAAQMTFFSPAKYAILPELFPPHRLARANGILEMTRYLAIIAGSAAGTVLIQYSGQRPGLIGGALVAIAIVGTFAAMRVGRVPDPAPTGPFELNPWAGLASGMRRIWCDHILRSAAVGLTLLEFFATWTAFVVLLFGKTKMGLDDVATGLLAAFAGIGVGIGSLAAGRKGARCIGIRAALPGIVAMGGALMALPAARGSFILAASLVMLLGVGAGRVLVLLNASLQHGAARGEKGCVIAANNCLNMAGVMVASAALWFLGSALGLDPEWMLLLGGGIVLLLAAVAAGVAWPRGGVKIALSLAP